jgi:hypothetical protein
MYVRVVTGCLKLPTLDRGLGVLERDIRPHVGARSGFAGWELFVDRSTGAFHAVTRWTSETEALGAAKDGFSDRAGMLRGLLEGEVTQAIFEVVD